MVDRRRRCLESRIRRSDDRATDDGFVTGCSRLALSGIRVDDSGHVRPTLYLSGDPGVDFEKTSW
jgi:hypothetical protein